MRQDASTLPRSSGGLDSVNGDRDQGPDPKKPKAKSAPNGAIPKTKTAEQEAKAVSLQRMVFFVMHSLSKGYSKHCNIHKVFVA